MLIREIRRLTGLFQFINNYSMNTMSTYEQLGGSEGLREIVDRFYDLMAELPEAKGILSLHPEDLTESRDKLFKFLSGLYGGPSLYIQEYGHPMLRARHLPFPIGEDEMDKRLLCMNRAVDELVSDEQLRSAEDEFFRTADHMHRRGRVVLLSDHLASGIHELGEKRCQSFK